MNTLLFQRFAFKKPILIEDMEEGKGDEIIAYQDRIIVKMDKEGEDKDLAEILSKAKMGESDPLLATFYFQKNITEEEYRYIRMFHNLCLPLLDAWAYKTMREWAPDIYIQEIEEITNMVAGDTFTLKVEDTGDMDLRRMYLGYWAILQENPKNEVKMNLKTSEEHKEAWEGYIALLKEFTRMEPDIALFLALPVTTKAPYNVQILIDGDGNKYFDVRGH